MTRPVDRSGEAGETALAGSTVGESGGALKAQAPNSSNINQIAKGLSEEAKRDVRDGNCLMASSACVCGSSIVVKGELAHHRLASFPADPDAGCLLTHLGRALRTHLKGLPND